MGMSEKEYNECSPLWLVRRLNGRMTADRSRTKLMMALVRDICYYAGNGGNFKKGVAKHDIYLLPGEKELLEKRRKELRVQLEQEKEQMKKWRIPNFGPPQGKA
jgi:hypothetical protein